ncbi:DUF3631 domain-containing protein [Pseudonocardia sp. ICBG1142]|uniref:DUF3631 domain-containing protein n=1 Tax=Pseudonocardia sp. ICBG1142 TaxID=2846760 RepID=UPI001CF713D3|nr:DUF3631 domain-containing protein [Pseudonocardia sp. ICBG1142]
MEDTEGTENAGAELLDDVLSVLRRYVILPSEAAAHAVTLWIAATHAQPAWAHAARLVIRAPEKRCGKSRLLDIVEALCWNAFITVNSSPSAIFRSITDDPPTLLVDEADTIFGPAAGANEDLRGLLNAGHQRNRPAMRYDAAKQQVERIPTFAMAALAGIGTMPDTIEDRAVIVRMRRRADGEHVDPYRFRRDRPALQTLCGSLHRWVRQVLPALEQAAPAMPVEDRAADTWEPLVAIADHAGGDWPDRARAAIIALLGEAYDNDQGSERVRLLIDCHAALADLQAIPSKLLLERLRADPDAPWSEFGGPAGLTIRKLGLMLADFGIRSTTLRFTEGQMKGYRCVDFSDAWHRYTPSVFDSDGAETDVEAADTEPGGPDIRTKRPKRRTAGQARDACSPGTDTSVPPDEPRYGYKRPTETSVPPLTRHATLGTLGTDTPHLRAVGGGA